MKTNLFHIANNFQFEGEIKSIKPLGEGFINDTFFVKTIDENTPDYLLQRKNKTIFTDIPAMMDNIERVTSHLKEKIELSGGDPMREAMTIIKSNDNKLYHLDDGGEYWAICQFIKDSITYEAADSPELAYSGGRGIGKFQAMTADFKGKLADILPGFHNIGYRFEQWDNVLTKNSAARKESVQKEISWIEERREEMLGFWQLVEDGTLPTRVTHNDTKINNILFDEKGDVLCVIDLDTVLSSTVLNDFGDAIRSYSNTGLEDDKDLENVSMDIELFKAYTNGYLEETKPFLIKTEIDYLAFSAKYITYEQVLRFLMDYIDGDNYYKTKYADHNLIRARAQQRLLQSMEQQFDTMNEIVKSFFR